MHQGGAGVHRRGRQVQVQGVLNNWSHQWLIANGNGSGQQGVHGLHGAGQRHTLPVEGSADGTLRQSSKLCQVNGLRDEGADGSIDIYWWRLGAHKTNLAVKTTNIICAPPALATLTIPDTAFRARAIPVMPKPKSSIPCRLPQFQSIAVKPKPISSLLSHFSLANIGNQSNLSPCNVAAGHRTIQFLFCRSCVH
jgi:hypothetical protein